MMRLKCPSPATPLLLESVLPQVVASTHHETWKPIWDTYTRVISTSWICNIQYGCRHIRHQAPPGKPCFEPGSGSRTSFDQQHRLSYQPFKNDIKNFHRDIREKWNGNWRESDVAEERSNHSIVAR
ncbi:hypothetical protein B0O80DRAFT_434210 [Mortierella sp. GBAus27b]|nr:hypothetical protein B0O80DRAFT_434210 [Mortierella sp. GBAus27b]